MNGKTLRTAIGAQGLLGVLLLAGCTTSWAPRETLSPIALAWPYPPAAARVTFERTITGFDRRAGTATALRTLAIGESDGADGSFLLPSAVATAPDGRIAVADLGARAVHLFVPATKTYERIAGGAEGPFVSPVGVAFDDDGRLYVTDSVGVVSAFDVAGKSRFALRSLSGTPLGRPSGIAWSPLSKLVYVADTTAHRIHAIHPDGTAAFSFGERGVGAGQLNFPTHLSVDRNGALYVTDALNFRVQVFDASGRAVATFGRHGDGTGDFASPKGIAVDGDGTIYVVDALFDVVQLFAPDGTFLLTVGRRGNGLGEMWLPSGAFLDRDGRLYVCDTYNHRVQVFRVAGEAKRG